MTRYFQAACLGIAILFASCKKDVQPVAISEIESAPPPKEIRKCEISRLVSITKYGGGHADTQKVVFEYNKKGDPVSVTPSLIGTGTPKLLFRYNDKGWLTDFIGVYNALSGGGFEYWHKYGHNNKGQIIFDTTYLFGIYANGPASGYLVTYSEYDYDKQGRISRVWAQSLSYPPVTVDVVYDANGNLPRPGVVYDDQVSIFRTNEVWMFIMKNYSRNNAITAISYNSAGLPLEFNSPPPPIAMFQTWQLNYSTIEYNCKGN